MLDNLYQEETDKVLDDRVARPLPEPAARPSFGVNVWRTLKAPVTGTVAGANESFAFGSDMLGAFGSVQAGYGLQADPSLLFDPEAQKKRIADGQKARQDIQTGEAFSTELGTNLRARARDLLPDPATSNMAEELLFGFTRFGSKAVGYSIAGGPVGPVFMGADEALTEADRLKAEGVDFQTRTKVGAVAGASSAAAVALPVAGQTVKQTIGLVAVGGPGGFIAQQAASKAILENAGYDKIADQYDPFDPVGLAVSTLIPAGFGAYAMRGARPVPKQSGIDPSKSRELMDMGGNERLALKYDDPRLDAYAVTAAQREGIPPEALLAIKNVGEKSGPTAVSPKGAKGVMQFMPDTWEAYGKGRDPRDPVASIDSAAGMMRDLIKQYGGNVRAAIAHYNGGTKAGKAVMEGKAPPAKETQDYLTRTDEYLAQRQGTEAGKAAANDPEAVAAARVALMRETVESMNLHAADDIPGITRHVEAVGRAGDQLAAGQRVDMSDIIESERIDLQRAYDLVRAMHEGDRFDPMVTIRPEDMEEVAISRGGWKGLGDMEVKGSGFGLVKFIWRHGEESSKAPEMQISREDLMAFPEIVRNYEPSRMPTDDGSRGREWRATLPDAKGKLRTVVFAENKVKGSDVRQVVSAYVQDPNHIDAGAPLSQKKQKPLNPAPEVESPSADTSSKVSLPSERSGDGTSITKTEPGTSAAVSSSAETQAAEIARLNPDMLVQLDGMESPMKLSEALEAVKAEAAKEAQDAPLLQVAAECFLRSS